MHLFPLWRWMRAHSPIVPSSMLPIVSGINSRLPSVINHALISLILPHPVLWVALPPSVPSTHHRLYFHHPFTRVTPGLKPSFSANPSHRSLPFVFFLDWLHGFPGLFTDTSEHIRFYFLIFLFYIFYLSVPCGRLSWLMSAFERTLK